MTAGVYADRVRAIRAELETEANEAARVAREKVIQRAKAKCMALLQRVPEADRAAAIAMADATMPLPPHAAESAP